MTPSLKARLLDPTWIFGIIGSLCGLALMFVTPPFEVPDEPNHFYRAYQVSEGTFVSETQTGQKFAGGRLPASLSRTVSHLVREIPFHPRNKYSHSWTEEALGFDLSPEARQFVTFPNTVLYSPAAYLPQAAGIALARVFEPSPIVLFYAGRIAALTFTIVLGCWALRMAPCFRWPLLLLLLMPMTMFQAASLSADVVVNALSIAFFASILGGVYGSSNPVGNTRKVQWVVLFVLITLAKTVYFLLGLLIFLIPSDRLGGRRRQLGFLAVFFALGGIAFVAWSRIADSLYVPFHPDQHTDLHAQLRLVVANPIGFIEIVYRSFLRHYTGYRHTFIGTLGWLDVRLPRKILDGYAALLLAAALVDGHRGWKLGITRRAWVCLVALTGFFGISLSIYCLWSEVGSPILDTLQGRYFIPLAPVVLLTLYNTTLADRLECWHKAAVAVSALSLTWLVTILRLLARYYSWG